MVNEFLLYWIHPEIFYGQIWCILYLWYNSESEKLWSFLWILPLLLHFFKKRQLWSKDVRRDKAESKCIAMGSIFSCFEHLWILPKVDSSEERYTSKKIRNFCYCINFLNSAGKHYTTFLDYYRCSFTNLMRFKWDGFQVTRNEDARVNLKINHNITHHFFKLFRITNGITMKQRDSYKGAFLINCDFNWLGNIFYTDNSPFTSPKNAVDKLWIRKFFLHKNFNFLLLFLSVFIFSFIVYSSWQLISSKLLCFLPLIFRNFSLKKILLFLSQNASLFVLTNESREKFLVSLTLDAIIYPSFSFIKWS